MLTLTGTIIGRNHRPAGNMHGVMNNGQPWPMDQVSEIEDVKLTIRLGANVQPSEMDIRVPQLPTEMFRIGTAVTVAIFEGEGPVPIINTDPGVRVEKAVNLDARATAAPASLRKAIDE